MKFSYLAIAALLMGILGCGKDSGDPRSVFDMRPGTVLVRVNGQDVTAGDYRNRFAVERAIYRYQNRTKPANQLETACDRFMESRKPKVVTELINQSLVKGFMKDKGFSVPEDVLENAMKGYLKKFKYKGSVKAFADELGVDEKYLRDQLTAPERVAAARNVFGKGPFTVSEKEVDEGLERQTKYYERAVASNAVTYVTASNVFKEVKAGLDFKEAAKKYSQFDPEDGERWQRLDAPEITNPEMKKWAFSAPLGSVGGPWDMDDGLCIFKLLERTEGTMEDSVVTEMVADVTLARISFYMLNPEPEPRTREFVKDALLKWKQNQAQKSLFEELHAKMRLEYPSGTNINFKTTQKP